MHSRAFYLHFPFPASFYALSVSSPEALRLVGVLECIVTTGGFEMARNVLTNEQVNEKGSSGALDHNPMPLCALPAPSGVR